MSTEWHKRAFEVDSAASSLPSSPTPSSLSSCESTTSLSDEEISPDSTPPSSPKLESKPPLKPSTTRQAREWRKTSTMHEKTFWEMNLSEKILSSSMMDDSHHTIKDFHRGPVPSIPLWKDMAFLIPTTGLAPAIQEVCMRLGYRWSATTAFVFYFASLALFFMLSAARFNRLGKKYGTFNDYNRGRDRIPDEHQDIMSSGIVLYFAYRTWSAVHFYYDPEQFPSSNFSWSYIARYQAWFIVMDLMFYCYHRATHEHDLLWGIHSQHHTARSPTMAHAILAGHMQHLCEIVVIPSLATMAVEMSFHEQWILYLCLAHIETMGHTGIRIHAANPNTWLSCLPFGAELTTEDHDLHHRYGKSGRNFGKQTRLWDKLFGTLQPREETADCKTRWI